MFLWLGSAIALIILHVVLHDNLVTIKGVPCGNGSYHTLAFIERVLGRLQETWPRMAMNRDIRFPQFLTPTSRYKNWLSTDMRTIHREENDHKKSNKRKRT